MLTAADLIQALSNLDHPSTARTANTPSSGTPATAHQLPTPYQPSAGTLMTAAATPTPTGPANAMGGRGGSDLPQSGSIRDRELPLPLPPAPPPSPALPAAAHRRRRDGRPVPQVGTLPAQAVPYGSSPAVHPDTGAPLAASVGPRRGKPAWAAGRVDKVALADLNGDDTAKTHVVATLVGRLKLYTAA